jgi:hypothetical protein
MSEIKASDLGKLPPGAVANYRIVLDDKAHEFVDIQDFEWWARLRQNGRLDTSDPKYRVQHGESARDRMIRRDAIAYKSAQGVQAEPLTPEPMTTVTSGPALAPLWKEAPQPVPAAREDRLDDGETAQERYLKRTQEAWKDGGGE